MASAVFALAIAPELAGVVLRTYGWLIILEDHGFINNALIVLGVISEPLALSKNLFAVVVGLTHVLLPFGVLSLLPSIQGIDRNIEKSAQILGASRLSVLRHIILPLSVPGIISSFLIAFTLSASAYATPALIGGAGLSGPGDDDLRTAALLVDWPFAAVMANILLIIVVGIAFASSRIESRLHAKLKYRSARHEPRLVVRLPVGALRDPALHRVADSRRRGCLGQPHVDGHLSAVGMDVCLVRQALVARWLNPFYLSVKIAAVVAIISGVLGVLAAYAVVYERIPGSTFIMPFLLSPLSVPQIVKGVAIVLFLSSAGSRASRHAGSDCRPCRADPAIHDAHGRDVDVQLRPQP